MADKLTPLLVDALARAVAEPGGSPLFGSKAAPGLFPNTAAAKPAAQKCLAEGLIRKLDAGDPRDLYAAAPAGLQYLVDRESPKRVLEDFVRLLEEREGQVRELLAQAGRMAASLDGLRSAVAALLPKVTSARVPAHPEPPRRGAPPDLADTLVRKLREWATAAGVPRDCPLPDLHRGLDPRPTPGEFHDALRRLHDAGRVYLHPWTGPLYALPEPTLALLSGHEIAYYASPRQPAPAPPHASPTPALSYA